MTCVGDSQQHAKNETCVTTVHTTASDGIMNAYSRALGVKPLSGLNALDASPSRPEQLLSTNLLYTKAMQDMAS